MTMYVKRLYFCPGGGGVNRTFPCFRLMPKRLWGLRCFTRLGGSKLPYLDLPFPLQRVPQVVLHLLL